MSWSIRRRSPIPKSSRWTSRRIEKLFGQVFIEHFHFAVPLLVFSDDLVAAELGERRDAFPRPERAAFVVHHVHLLSVSADGLGEGLDDHVGAPV